MNEPLTQGNPPLRLLVDMLQTRLEAAVLTAQIERDALWHILRWRCIGAGALLLAGWALLLLLAVWLPPSARIGVLAAVSVGLLLVWAWSQRQLAQQRAHRTPAGHQLLDAVRRDLEALGGALSRTPDVPD